MVDTPPYVFIAWCLIKHRDNFTFTFYILAFHKVHCIHPQDPVCRLACNGNLRNYSSLQYFLCIIFTDITADVATVFNEMAGTARWDKPSFCNFL
jgi:hypothetical protein